MIRLYEVIKWEWRCGMKCGDVKHVVSENKLNDTDFTLSPNYTSVDVIELNIYEVTDITKLIGLSLIDLKKLIDGM